MAVGSRIWEGNIAKSKIHLEVRKRGAGRQNFWGGSGLTIYTLYKKYWGARAARARYIQFFEVTATKIDLLKMVIFQKFGRAA